MSTVEHQLIIPGDQIPLLEPSKDITLGPNITIGKANELIPTTSGFLNVQSKKSNDLYFIESNTKRYLPMINDFVIGTIIGSFGENYKVSLNNFSAPVVLNQFAFPNATKKNRPHLKIGDVVYARVSQCDKDLDVELECIDQITGKEGGFGLLTDGFLLEVKLAFARYLLFTPDSAILNKLVTKCKFEIAIGVNGRIWIKTDDVKTTIVVSSCLKDSQDWKQSEISNKVDDLFKSFGL